MRLLLAFFVFSSLLSCELMPCGDKDQFIENFEEFLDETKASAEDYSKSDWTKAKAKFDKMTRDCYQVHKDEMSKSEQMLFWKDAVHVMIIQGAKDINIDLDDNEELKFSFDENEGKDEDNYIEKEIEEVFEGSEEELKVIVDDFLKEEAPKLIDKAMEGLEKFAEELKEALKEDK